MSSYKSKINQKRINITQDYTLKDFNPDKQINQTSIGQ